MKRVFVVMLALLTLSASAETNPTDVFMGRWRDQRVPDAEMKIYLEATPETRARRRYLENLSKNIKETYENILADIIKRDKADSERTVAPLRPADDAVIIHTDDLTAEEVAQKIFDLME